MADQDEVTLRDKFLILSKKIDDWSKEIADLQKMIKNIKLEKERTELEMKEFGIDKMDLADGYYSSGMKSFNWSSRGKSYSHNRSIFPKGLHVPNE